MSRKMTSTRTMVLCMWKQDDVVVLVVNNNGYHTISYNNGELELANNCGQARSRREAVKMKIIY